MNVLRRPFVPPADTAGTGLPALVHVLNERDSLQLAHRVARAARNDGKLVQFIGPQGGEGTSTIARDFVLTMAGRGERPVLLLDLDRPANRQLGWFDRNGVPMVVDGTLDVMPGVEAFRLHRLIGTPLVVAEQVLDDGQKPIHPEVLARSGVLQRLRDMFDLVVVDSPPVGRSFDGVSLGADMDATVVVLQAERTRAAVARDVCERLTESGANLAGFVFNRRRQLIPSFLYRWFG